jgi:hypothetical protein
MERGSIDAGLLNRIRPNPCFWFHKRRHAAIRIIATHCPVSAADFARKESRMYVRFAIVTVLLALVSESPAQSHTTIGDVALDTPAGWSAARDHDTMQLTPGGLPAGSTCVVIVKPTEPLSEDFSQWFNKKWNSVLKIGTKVVQSSQPKHKAETGSDNDSIFASAVVQNEQNKPVWLLLFGIRVRLSVFPILWTASSQQLLGQYESAVTQVVGSLKVEATSASGGISSSRGAPKSAGLQNEDGNGAIPPDTPPPPNRLSGVYAGFFIGHGVGSSGFEMNAFVFYPDGTAMYLRTKAWTDTTWPRTSVEGLTA